ncbi:MAG: efflux RND transporter periplasmic adaptor subunit [Planctomycetales bacterium]
MSKFQTLIAVAALCVSSLAGCGGEANSKSSSSAAVGDSGPASALTVKAAVRKHKETLALPGASVHGFETTLLMAKLGGYVEEIQAVDGETIDIGTVVAEGDLLAVLAVPEMLDELAEKDALVQQAESTIAQADAEIVQANAEVTRRKAEVSQSKTLLEQKQAMVDFRQLDRDRYRDLVERMSARRELLDQAEAQFRAAEADQKTAGAAIETAQANLKAAEAMIVKAEADKVAAKAGVNVAKAAKSRVHTLADYARITAPYAGVITKRMVDHGAFVQPATNNSSATPLFEITRNDKVRVVASVPMTQASRIALGQDVVLHNIGGLPGARIAGKVTKSSVALDQASRMLRVDVHLDNPAMDLITGKEFTLRPGMFGTVTVTLAVYDELPVVPTTAVGVDENGHSYVMTIENGSVCRKRLVSLAFNDGKDAGVREGLQMGEEVVRSSVDQFQDGQEITPHAK